MERSGVGTNWRAVTSSAGELQSAQLDQRPPACLYCIPWTTTRSVTVRHMMQPLQVSLTLPACRCQLDGSTKQSSRQSRQTQSPHTQRQPEALATSSQSSTRKTFTGCSGRLAAEMCVQRPRLALPYVCFQVPSDVVVDMFAHWVFEGVLYTAELYEGYDSDESKPPADWPECERLYAAP